MINFHLNEPSQVLMKLFSVDGKKVLTIADKSFEAGTHQLPLTPIKNLPCGEVGGACYFLQLKSDEGIIIKKLIIQ